MSAEPVSAAVGAALEVGGGTCRVWPEQEEGPYHRDHPPVRRGVVEDAPELPLTLGLRLLGGDRLPLTAAVAVMLAHPSTEKAFRGIVADLAERRTTAAIPEPAVGRA